MTAASKETQLSSLQKIQSLEKDHHTLSEQLAQVAAILSSPDVLKVATSDYSIAARSLSRYQGRTEWALKWLLGKLRAADTVGQAARSAPEAWTLLGNLIQHLNLLASSKLLAGSSFVHLVGTALLENFEGHFRTGTHFGATSNSSKAIDQSIVESTPSNDSKSKHKRKHETLDPTPVVRKSAKRTKHDSLNKVEAKEMSAPDGSYIEKKELFRAISGVLLTALRSAEEKGHGEQSTTREQLRATLATEPRAAAQLVRGWLCAMYAAVNWTVSSRSTGKTVNPPLDTVFDLSPALYMWKNRTRTSDDGEDQDLACFSEECLVPACALLSLLHHEKFDRTEVQTVRLCEKSLQNFIAANFLLPIKRRQRGESTLAAKNSRQSTFAVENQQLLGLLRPLKASIHSDSIPPIARSVPLLFELAIDSAMPPSSTPQRRIAERPWLEKVFLSLGDCLNIVVDKTTDERPKSVNTEVMNDLLSKASTKNVFLSPDVLSNILYNLSGLAQPAEEELDWPLIARVVNLNADFLLTSSFSDARVARVQADMRQNLFDLITRLGRVSWRQKMIVSSGSPPEDTTYLNIKDGIIIPLMKAYAAARSLPAFLELWHTCLVNLFEHETSEIRDSEQVPSTSVWEDSGLSVSLELLLRSTMTVKRLAEFLDKVSEEARQSLHSKRDGANLLADMSLMKMILQAVTDMDALQILTPRIRLILNLAVEMYQSSSFRLRTRAARLVAIGHRLLANVDDYDSFVTSSSAACSVASRLLKQDHENLSSLESQNTAEMYLESLACMASLVTDLSTRNMPLDESSKAKIMSSLSVPSNTEDIDGYSKHCMLATFAQYPKLLVLNRNRELRVKDTSVRPAEDVEHHGTTLFAIGTRGSTSVKQVVHCGGCELNESLLVEYVADHDTKLATAYLGLPRPQSKGQSPDSASIGTMAIENLDSCRSIPTRSWSVSEREILLDQTCGLLLEGTDKTSKSSIQASLDFLGQLLVAGGRNARILQNMDTVWQIASHLDKVYRSTDRITEALTEDELWKSIIDPIMRHHWAKSDEQDAHDVLETSLCHEAEKILEATDATTLTNDPASVTLIASAMNHLQKEGGESISRRISKLRDRLYSLLQDAVAGLVNQLEEQREYQNSDRRALGLRQNVKIYRCLVILARSESRINTVKPSQDSSWAELSARNVNLDALHPSSKALLFKVHASSLSHRGEMVDLDSCLAILEVCLELEDRSLVCDSFCTALLSLADEMYAKKRATVVQAMLENADQHPSAYRLLYHLARRPNQKDRRLIEPLEVPGVVDRLSSDLVRTTSMTSFSQITATLEALLIDHPKLITQSAIETILLALSVVLSSQGPDLPQRHASRIYDGLSRLMHLLLTHHRRRLNGRHDLLVNTLQLLLHPLFAPEPLSTRSPAAAHHIPRPPWLPKSSSPLNAQHALHYARLLILLCDPSLVAVRDSSASATPLTDTASKARRYAARHVPLLLADLCRCMLHGRLPRSEGGRGAQDDVRTQLLLGIDVVLDVVAAGDGKGAKSEGFEVVNAALGAGERVVFRSLVDDWRRRREREREAR